MDQKQFAQDQEYVKDIIKDELRLELKRAYHPII
jgi:hypothetical protein